VKINFFYVYILFSLKDKKLYIGDTENLKIRLGEHFNGRVKATANRRPLEIIHYEAFTDIRDAKVRERFLKSGFGQSQMKKALQNKLKELGYQPSQTRYQLS
jgi:putative endonuclease